MDSRCIVITGASSGIGKAISSECIEAGYQVVGLCRAVDRVVSGVTPIACDLSDPAQIQNAFSLINEQVGSVDVLVNNAGVAYLSGILDGEMVDWDTMWKVNVRGLALCCQQAFKLLNPETGQVINVSSMSGHRVPPSGGFYAPTKFAVRGVTDSLRAELKTRKSKIRVSSISPGFVDTPLLDDYFQGREEALAQTKKSMKMLTSEDVAKSVMHIIDSPMHVEHGDIQLRSVDQAM